MKHRFITFITITIVFASIISLSGCKSSKNMQNNTNIAKSKTEQKSSTVKNTSQNNMSNVQNNKEKELDSKFDQSFALFRDKKYAESIKLADEIINEDPNYYKIYAIKGLALSYNGNFQAGMQSIDKSLQLNPDYGLARYSKALSYELYGYYDDALKWYNKDLEVENYVWSYYGMSSIYGRRGDVKNTVKYLKIAVSMDPSIKNLAKDEKDFNPVKNTAEFQNVIK